MKKKIIIFGETGNTGSYLLEYALNFQKGNTILFCGHYEGRRF